MPPTPQGLGTNCSRRVVKNILQALPVDCERVRLTSNEERGFGLDDIRHGVHTIYIRNLSPPSISKPIVRPGILMQVARHSGSNELCIQCKGIGRLIQECTILQVKTYRYNQHV